MLRIDKELKQKELAKILGIAQPSISDWENEITRPDWENLIKLANFFNVTIDFLLNREEKEFDFYYFSDRDKRIIKEKNKKEKLK